MRLNICYVGVPLIDIFRNKCYDVTQTRLAQKTNVDRIKELEETNKQLLSELECYRQRNYGGRKKHNEAWMEAYNDFAVKYESGMTIMEIATESKISRRTAYRYKSYYDKLKGGRK